jgi:hypothetical protein
MKFARFFSVIFAVIGAVLLIGCLGFFLLNRNADVRIRELPEEAVQVSDAFVQALNDGDLETAAQLMYGQPDLGIGQVSGNPESALVWDAFCDQIAVELAREWSVEQSALVKNGSITTLDVAGILEQLPERTQMLMNQRIAAAEELSELYDENNQFREELVTQILQEALDQSLRQDLQTITRDITLKLVNRDCSWWIVPDQALMHALAGWA